VHPQKIDERSSKMLNVRLLTLVGIVVGAAAMRLIPHPPNFAPIMAIALFGGAYFANKKAAFAVPLAAMFLSDLFLGFDGSMPFVYGSFALTVCLGLMIRDRRSPLRIGSFALGGSVLFFIITNFGVWLSGSLYPRTVEGLIACYIAAIPFFGNTLLGDVMYTLVLFGGFALAQRYSSALRKGSAPMLGGNA
jgi:hypothetical protein